jgi:hypothetical protein
MRTVSDDMVRLHLLPSCSATITSRGIKVKNMYYGSELALKENWFEKARNMQGTWKVEVCYDPRNMSYVYIKDKDNNGFEKCFLLEHQSKFKNKNLEEMEQFMESSNKNNSIQSKVDLMSEIETIVKEAEKLTVVGLNNESDRSKIKGIRNNRQIEKLINRSSEAFELGRKELKEKAEVVELHDNNEESPDNSINLLRKKQKEKLNGIHK